MLACFFLRKYHFDLYILGLQLIWSLHFGIDQFGLYYYKFTINLVPTIGWDVDVKFK